MYGLRLWWLPSGQGSVSFTLWTSHLLSLALDFTYRNLRYIGRWKWTSILSYATYSSFTLWKTSDWMISSPVRRFLLIHIWSNVWSSALESFAGPWENVIQSVMTWPWSEVKSVLVHKTKGAGQAQRSRLKGSSIGMFNFDQPWFGPMPKKERRSKIGVI